LGNKSEILINDLQLQEGKIGQTSSCRPITFSWIIWRTYRNKLSKVLKTFLN